MLKRISDFFFILVRPHYWLSIESTCYKWDARVNYLLDNYTPTSISSHVIVINNINIWIANYPYAYGSHWGGPSDVIPRPKTRVRLKKVVDKYLQMQENLYYSKLDNTIKNTQYNKNVLKLVRKNENK